MTRTPGAVIFDCDGVLVDSERLMTREFSAMLNEIGLPYSAEETTRTFMGRSMKSCMQIVESQLGRAVPDDFLAVLDQRAYAVFERDLLPVAGVEALLDALDRSSTPYAVASSGSHEKMRTTLGITGLLPRLAGRITSATEVANGKPAPDVFLPGGLFAGVSARGAGCRRTCARSRPKPCGAHHLRERSSFLCFARTIVRVARHWRR